MGKDSPSEGDQEESLLMCLHLEMFDSKFSWALSDRTKRPKFCNAVSNVQLLWSSQVATGRSARAIKNALRVHAYRLEIINLRN